MNSAEELLAKENLSIVSVELLRCLLDAVKFRRRDERIMLNPVLLHYCSEYAVFTEKKRMVLRDFRKSFVASPSNPKKMKLFGSSGIDVNANMTSEEQIDV